MTDPTERWMPGVPAAARWLGLAGLLPFAGLAVLCWLAEPPAAASATASPVRSGGAPDMLTGYGAIILSFMGGCRWGFASAGLGDGPHWEGPSWEGPSWQRLGVSVSPALYAWVAAALPAPAAMLALGIGFLALLAADVVLTRAGGAPAWWPTLRWPLSIGAAASLIAAAPAAPAG